MMRLFARAMLSGIAILGAIFSQPAFAASIEVKTALGVLVGETEEGIAVFKGVPYAKPPVDELRWKPPSELSPWDGARDARAFGPACVQPKQSIKAFYYVPLPQVSEDCLYLNIWIEISDAGKADRSHKKPVMVWIHGGSLISGTGASKLYDGATLAKKGVVVVTINYRLNIFGYFTHSELNKESPCGASGNYGVQDQIAALRWVRDNIASFGGDPDNITIFGESAGGLSVSHLMASPLARGLFHKAIMQSAYMPPSRRMNERRYDKLSGVEIGEGFTQEAGASSLAELRDLSTEDILQAAIRYRFYPETVVDGYVFEEDIIETFVAGRQADTPLIAGFNSGEVYSFAGFGLIPPVPETFESYIGEVKARYGEKANRYLALYPPTDLRASVFSATRDAIYGWAAEAFVRSMMNKNAKGYFYFFDHMTPEAVDRKLYAFHASEIPYVFQNLARDVMSPSWPELESADVNQTMSDAMSDYWVAFAKRGKPAPRGRPKWPEYKEKKRSYMHFSGGAAMPQVHLNPDMFEFHNEIIEARRKEGQLSWRFFEVGLFSPIIDDE